MVYLGKSKQPLRNDTFIISWLFSFRVIQPTGLWHIFTTFMFVFINSCSLQKSFQGSRLWHLFGYEYLINLELIWFSATKYKPKLSHGLTCHFMFDRLHWCAKQMNRTRVLSGELWYIITPFGLIAFIYTLAFSNVSLVLALNFIVHRF